MKTKMKEHIVYGLIDELDDEIVHVHERHKVGECPYCDMVRVESITREFIRRSEACEPKVSHLYLWSLGTSLTDTSMNRKLIQKRWHRFQASMHRVEKWKPLFRVMEKGRRGFLHFHVICESFCEHRVVLNVWRSLTKEKSNVHVSGHKGTQDTRRLTKYLLKYLSKESSKYWWLGRFHGMGSVKRSVAPSRQFRGSPGETSYRFNTIAYPVRESQRKLHKE